MEFAVQLRSQIEASYGASGNNLGWRFLSSPADVLLRAEVAFVGLNPGGTTEPPDHAEFCMVRGSAYLDESWPPANRPGQHRLQLQVLALFKGLNVQPDAVLAGNLVPFRSPNWASLKNPELSLQFGEALWRQVLFRTRPRLVVAMGKQAYASLSRVLEADAPDLVDVSWGAVKAARSNFPNGTLVGLPHLSRYGIMTRPASYAALRGLFQDKWIS